MDSPTTTSAPQNTVSWQSAFWALVPLALNSMTQPSGMVCGFPSSQGFFLRSSPFMCVLDTLQIILRLIFTGRKAPRSTLQRIFKRRFRDVPLEDKGGFSSLQRNKPFRVALFLLGAMPQTIKLFAMRGIPWTQAFGLMYLVPFLIMEVLVLLTDTGDASAKFEAITSSSEAGTVPTTSIDVLRSVSAKILGVIALAISGSIPCAIIIAYLYPKLTSHQSSSFLLSNYGHLCSQYCKANIGNGGGKILISDLSLGIVVASSLAPTRFTSGKYEVAVGLFVYVALFMGWWGFERKTGIRFAGIWMFDNWYFLLRNVACAVLCYRFLYVEEGTLKPAWTDQLG